MNNEEHTMRTPMASQHADENQKKIKMYAKNPGQILMKQTRHFDMKNVGPMKDK